MGKAYTDKEYWNTRWNKGFFSYHRKGLAPLRFLTLPLYRRLNKIFNSHLPLDSNLTFIEIGCGGGKWLIYFSKKFGYQVSGVDFSEEGILATKKNVVSANVEAQIICQDVFSMAVKNRYDIVLSDGFLEHFDDTFQVLAHISSFVRPGGYFITIIPSLNGIQNYFVKLFRQEEKFETHKIITKRNLIESYENLGYTDITFYAIGSILPKIISLPRIVKRFLQGCFLALNSMGLYLEGEKISNTYVIIGRNSN